MFDMGPYGSGARFLLWIAIEKNDVALAEWVLGHGVNPSSAPARDPRFSKRSLYEDAVREGRNEIAELLLRHGAARVPLVLEGEDAFVAAALRLDRESVAAQLREHPEYRESPKALFIAAKRENAEAVALLLDVGTSIEVEDASARAPRRRETRRVARGAAAGRARRADRPPREELECRSDRLRRLLRPLPTLDYLSRYSKNVWVLAFRGYWSGCARCSPSSPIARRRRTNDLARVLEPPG